MVSVKRNNYYFRIFNSNFGHSLQIITFFAQKTPSTKFSIQAKHAHQRGESRQQMLERDAIWLIGFELRSHISMHRNRPQHRQEHRHVQGQVLCGVLPLRRHGANDKSSRNPRPERQQIAPKQPHCVRVDNRSHERVSAIPRRQSHLRFQGATDGHL